MSDEPTKGGWTKEEDALLATLQVESPGTLASHERDCFSRCTMTHLLNYGLAQAEHGNKWAVVAAKMNGRTGQQCAQRWRHKVCP